VFVFGEYYKSDDGSITVVIEETMSPATKFGLFQDSKSGKSGFFPCLDSAFYAIMDDIGNARSVTATDKIGKDVRLTLWPNDRLTASSIR
jgi:hypothetical protein